MAEITQAQLQERLNYDPETGVFTWAAPRSRVRVGAVAGRLNTRGYRVIETDGKPYMAHRLAWLYVYGSMPAFELDHINGQRDDNRLANLRELTHAQNCQNKRKARADSGTGVQGVSKVGNRYKAEITVNGQWLYLGRFPTVDAANDAYQRAKSALHVVGAA